MPNFLYAYPTAAFYPEITGPEGSLIAEPGDVCEFENPPSDGRWAETDLPVNDKPARRWPPAPQVSEATSEEVPEVQLPLDPPSDPPAEEPI